MTTTVTETGPYERLVTFQLSNEQIDEAKKGAARKLAQEVKIHGFRPGKAPLPVIEATLGADRVRQEAIEDLVSPVLAGVLDEESIEPAVSPELESMDEVDGGVEVGVRVTLWPTIELPDYTGRHIMVGSPLVTDEDMASQLRRILEQFATVEEVERPAEQGDFVSIDVKGAKDGDQVEEATAADLLYEVGSGLFLEGIDDHLLGVEAGVVVEFEAPLPDGFGDRAGESVAFTVTVNEIKERLLPELDDDWVDENTEFETVEELTSQLRLQLEEAKRRAASREYADKALESLRESVDLSLPEALVRAEMDNQLHTFVHRLEEAELTLEDYFNATGMAQDEFLDDLRNQAELSLSNRLILEAVAEKEDLKVTDDDMSNALQVLAGQSKDPVAFIQAFHRSGQELALASDILRNRALDAILTNAQPVDEEGNPVELTVDVPQVEAEVLDDEIVEGEVVATIEEEEE